VKSGTVPSREGRCAKVVRQTGSITARLGRRSSGRDGLVENCGRRKDFFRSLWSRDDPHYGDPWWKWLSASQEIETAAGSFDSVRLAPHFAQDDRQVSSSKMTGK